MAKVPTTQQGDIEQPTTQPGDSHIKASLAQHQQGDGKKSTPRRFTDWASI